MKNILKLEEVVQFLFGMYLFSLLPYAWWWFPALLLTLDIGMLDYLGGNKLGAFFYNLFHHKGVAIMLYLVGISIDNTLLQLVGTVLFAHAAFDRVLGYGLKYEKGFKFTHLGDL